MNGRGEARNNDLAAPTESWPVLRRWSWVIVAAWFVTLSSIRLSVLLPTTPGYDGMLYRDATVRWLAGGDPWAFGTGYAVFGALPPTLLTMLPFAAIPELAARIGLVALGILSSIWLVRRLRLPLWWLAFPPLVDGMYIANPQVLIVPLLVAGAGPLAAFVKAYAGVVFALMGDLKAVVVTAVALIVTAPFLPWRLFVERWPAVSAELAIHGGGLSVLATPWLLPIAVVAAIALGRERRAWWAVPVFWPYTQWYYASMILPVATPFAAMVVAIPVQGATTLAIVVAVLEMHWLRRKPSRPTS